MLSNKNGYGKGKRYYCRKCMKEKLKKDFYETTNEKLDSNGLLSICKDCINNIYNEYYNENNSFEKSIYLTCRDTDIMFNKDAISQTETHIENIINKGRNVNRPFGYYKSKLTSLLKSIKDLDYLRFHNSDDLYDEHGTHIDDDDFERYLDDDVIMFWGDGFSDSEISFLELELSKWKESYSSDNRGEITLLKEICIKILEIRKRRSDGGNVSVLQKELQELMKTASVDPAKANIATGGKNQETFGVWIKDIEQFKPAEWHDQQEKYKDMDGFTSYIEDYIVRPIRNFITGSRDFQIRDDININIYEGDD